MLGGLTWTLRFFPFEKDRGRHNYTSGRPTIAMMRQSISLSADVLNKPTHTTILAPPPIAYSVEIGPR